MPASLKKLNKIDHLNPPPGRIVEIIQYNLPSSLFSCSKRRKIKKILYNRPFRPHLSGRKVIIIH